ncbi:hypothetical protein C8Q79DRAFT_364200 [Trametes meyenii]|nr:hypothetical protein C8Q79DRAFT_364200 [Trametes meyenii]
MGSSQAADENARRRCQANCRASVHSSSTLVHVSSDDGTRREAYGSRARWTEAHDAGGEVWGSFKGGKCGDAIAGRGSASTTRPKREARAGDGGAGIARESSRASTLFHSGLDSRAASVSSSVGVARVGGHLPRMAHTGAAKGRRPIRTLRVAGARRGRRVWCGRTGLIVWHGPPGGGRGRHGGRGSASGTRTMCLLGGLGASVEYRPGGGPKRGVMSRREIIELAPGTGGPIWRRSGRQWRGVRRTATNLLGRISVSYSLLGSCLCTGLCE